MESEWSLHGSTSSSGSKLEYGYFIQHNWCNWYNYLFTEIKCHCEKEIPKNLIIQRNLLNGK